MTKPRVLIADKLSPAAIDIFKQRGVEADVKTGLSKEELLKIIGDYDGLAVRSATKADKELLFKGVTLALIGLVILLAPYVARSTSVRDLMGQVALVGWFALVLGIAFGVQYGLRRAKAGRRQP